MKKTTALLAAITLLSIISLTVQAQQVQRCHTDEYFEVLKAADPGLEARVQQVREDAIAWMNNPQNNARQAGVITIPVVVHVMHNGESVGQGKNISDDQILSQIDVLNEDYRALNSDIGDVPAHFSSVVADVGVEFCLAQFDPQGNPTDGIDRVDIGSSSWSDNLKASTTWDSDKYLNIWVADIGGGTLGYATFPGTSANEDGVVVDYLYFGSAPDNPFNSDFDLGRTATHEVGHWLGLYHTFQSGCAGTSSATCNNGGDGICDTPPTSSANYGCNISATANTCTESPNDRPDMWMNYMDYMDDACLLMFTQDQAAVMLSVLQTSRSGILTSEACESGFAYNGQVVDAQSGNPVPNASVSFISNVYRFEAITDAGGNFSFPGFRDGTYAVYAGKWGYATNEYSTNTTINAGAQALTIPIQQGQYYDDFVLDQQWTENGNATTGRWERGFPAGTTYQGAESNPGDDVPNDFSEIAYVTGNGGGGAGDDDVDDGNTILSSPVFDLTNYADPYITYERWFFNDGGNGTPDDELIITLTNGTDTEVLETVSTTDNQWTENMIRVQDYVQPTANMQFSIETADQANSGHLVEAGLDRFEVFDSVSVGIAGQAAQDALNMNIYPVPASNRAYISLSGTGFQNNGLLTVELYDLSGRAVLTEAMAAKPTLTLNLDGVAHGVYMLRVSNQEVSATGRLVVVR